MKSSKTASEMNLGFIESPALIKTFSSKTALRSKDVRNNESNFQIDLSPQSSPPKPTGGNLSVKRSNSSMT